jgi:import inner membrane translocase subunit TIM17
MENTPCPNKIFDDCGGAFWMGAVGGSAWHFLKGVRNSPKGDMLRGGMWNMALRAPILGGNFAVWGGLFSCYDCGIQYVRRKEDHWNAVMAGAAVGGTLAARSGWKSTGKNALIGGFLLGIIEGFSFLAGKLMTPDPVPTVPQRLHVKQGDVFAEQKSKHIPDTVGSDWNPDFALKEMNTVVWNDDDLFSLASDIETNAFQFTSAAYNTNPQ